MTFPMPFFTPVLAAGGVAVVDDISVGSNTDAASYTFPDVALTGGGTHKIIMVGARGSAAAPAINTVTSETISATQQVNLLTGFQRSSIWSVADSTATPDIVVTPSVTCGNIEVGVVAVTGLNSITASATNTSSADPAALDVNTQAGGIVVATGLGAGGSSMTWTGVTEFYDLVRETSFNYTGGYDLTPSAETPRTVSGDWASSSNNSACSAAFR